MTYDRVRDREDAAIGKVPVGLGDDPRAVVDLGTIGILDVVEAIAICLPLQHGLSTNKLYRATRRTISALTPETPSPLVFFTVAVK